MKKIIYKFFKSAIKLILPIIFKILIKLKINRRTINFLNEKSYKSNAYEEIENSTNFYYQKSQIEMSYMA